MDTKIFSSAPVLLVRDIHRAVDYYCDVLGFRRPRLWGDPPFFAMPDRDGVTVMLQQESNPALIMPNGSNGKNWDAYFWVNDAKALFNEFNSKGAQVGYPPTYRDTYGNLEFAVSDPDGYVLAFGQEVEDVPE